MLSWQVINCAKGCEAFLTHTLVFVHVLDGEDGATVRPLDWSSEDTKTRQANKIDLNIFIRL